MNTTGLTSVDVVTSSWLRSGGRCVAREAGVVSV